jgi:hypothetical protein
MLREARVKSRSGPSVQKKHMETVFPAPIGGWVSNTSIAKESPLSAEICENMIPTERGVRVKGGSRKFGTVGQLAVEDFMVYKSGTNEKLFAASNGGVYDVTSPAGPLAPIAPEFTGQTSNEYSSINFSTATGEFLIGVNGTDLHRVYDGTAWAQNVPAITGVSTASISQIAVHGERIWMVQKNTKVAWYLPVDSIGGVAVDFSLQGVFKKEGVCFSLPHGRRIPALVRMTAGWVFQPKAKLPFIAGTIRAARHG